MSTNSRADPGRGALVELEASGGGATVLVDLDRGSRLASFRIADRELLLGPPDATDASIRWGCFLMAPWPGRLADGRFEWRGRDIRVPRTHGRHAIHGMVWGEGWEVTERARSRLETTIDLRSVGWPFDGRVRQRLELFDDALVLDARIEAGEPQPAALGWHPWFRRDGDVRLRLDAAATLETRTMIPTGRRAALDQRTDLRDGPALGSRRIDATYVGVRWPAIVDWPDLRLRLEPEPALAAAVVYTPPDVFCVEPQTAWPNALGSLGSDGGARELDAGRSLAVRLSMRWSRR